MAATASSPRKQQRRRDPATSAVRRTPKPIGSTTALTSLSTRPELPQNLKYRITPKSLYPQQSAVPFCQYSTPQTNQKESGLPTGHHLKYNTLKEYYRLIKPYPPLQQDGTLYKTRYYNYLAFLAGLPYTCGPARPY
jgi:hypothetical protein